MVAAAAGCQPRHDDPLGVDRWATDPSTSAANRAQPRPHPLSIRRFRASAVGHPLHTAEGDVTINRFGHTVAGAGDVDGYYDRVVGHTYYPGLIPRQGRAWLYYGSPSGLALSSRWHLGVESVGFTYRSVTVPWPNAGWVAISAVVAGAGLILGTRFYYLRREARVVALQQVRETAQRQERQRLAQDLHDQLGADLTEVVLAGANVRQQLARNHPIEGKLAQMEATAGRLVESLAEIVWLTKPTNDTLPRLADHLGNLAVTTLEKSGFTCVLEIPARLPDVAIAFDLRHDLVLAVKEALHNAVKHSGGSSVTLAIRTEGRGLTITVRDNGRGFDPAGVSPTGNGLANMTARLIRHGGTAQVGPSPTGTSVSLVLPLPSFPKESRA